MWSVWRLKLLDLDLGRWNGGYFTPLSDSQVNTLVRCLEEMGRLSRLDEMNAHTWERRRDFERRVENFYNSI